MDQFGRLVGRYVRVSLSYGSHFQVNLSGGQSHVLYLKYDTQESGEQVTEEGGDAAET